MATIDLQEISRQMHEAVMNDSFFVNGGFFLLSPGTVDVQDKQVSQEHLCDSQVYDKRDS